jgi:hypothetical protein
MFETIFKWCLKPTSKMSRTCSDCYVQHQLHDGTISGLETHEKYLNTSSFP